VPGVCAPQQPIDAVKANLLLTHFDKFKETHPDGEKKESVRVDEKRAIILICSDVGAVLKNRDVFLRPQRPQR
jgi:hypothetical protein